MELHSQSGLGENNLLQSSIYFSLIKIKNVLHLSDAKVASLMDLNLGEYKKHKNEKFTQLPLNSWVEMCDKLNIHISNILKWELDDETLFRQYYGEKNYIPKHLTANPSSKLRSLKTYCDLISISLGSSLVEHILKKSQISSLAFKNLDQDIDIEVINNLLLEVGKKPLPNEFFKMLGKMNFLNFYKSPIFKEIFKDARKPKGYFELMFDYLIKNIDNNWAYQIKNSSTSGCTIEVRTQEWLQESKKTKSYGCEEIDYLRVGLAEGLGKIICDHEAHVALSKSPHHGDNCWEYEILYH